MAKKKIDSIRNLTLTELNQKITETEKELFANKVKHATGQLEKTGLLWKQRKEIARFKTLLAQKQNQKSAQK